VAALEWETLFDTAKPGSAPARFEGRQEYPLEARSLVLLRQVPLEEPPPAGAAGARTGTSA
jgi:hypothetical protein